MAALITAADLGIDTSTDQGLFDWLLASVLFGRPVPQKAAATAFRRFKEDGWDTPDHFIADDHHQLWRELWEGDYHRLSSVMSEELPDVMRGLIADYHGSVALLVRTASTREEVSERLQRFKGVGPKTARDFPPRSTPMRLSEPPEIAKGVDQPAYSCAAAPAGWPGAPVIPADAGH